MASIKYPKRPYQMSNGGSKHACFMYFTVLFAAFHAVLSLSDTCGTVMYTDKQVYIIGETIHINCSTSSSLTPDPSKFYLLHISNNNNHGTNASAIFDITGTVARTTIKVKDTLDSGTYICYYGNCTTVLLTSFQTIVVKSSLPPKLTCVWENRWNLTCRWGDRAQEGVLEWRMTYKQEGTAVYNCCVGPSGTCWEFSADQSCYIAANNTVPYLTYTMRLDSRWSDNSTASYTYTIDVDESILRCHLDTMSASSSTPGQLNLAAMADCAPVSVGGVVCHVTATSQWEPNVTVSNSCESTSGDLQVNCTMEGLEPYTRYSLCLKCRPRSSLYWSNTVDTTATTLPEPPVMSPKIIGYSEQVVDKHFRDIVLYVEPLPDRQRYGRDASIVIVFETNGMAYERVVDASSCSVSLNASFHNAKTYIVTMVASNEAGMSNNSSTIDIGISKSSSGDVVIDQQDFANYDVLLFGFESQRQASRTCYYSCWVSTLDYTIPPVCEEMLSQMCVSGFHHSYNMDVDPVNRKYISRRETAYGVRFGRDSTTEEIYWSKCVFYKNPKDRPAPYIMWRRTNESTVDVDLSNSLYCQQGMRPLAYQVDAMTESTNRSCPFKDADNITATPELRHIQLSVNPKEHVLSVCFSVFYTGHAYPESIRDASVVLDLKATPANSGQSTKASSVQIAVGVALGAGVGLLFMLILGLRKYHQRVKSRSLVQDILPSPTLSQEDPIAYGYSRRRDSSENHDVNYDTVHDVRSNDMPEGSYTKIDDTTSIEAALITRSRTENDIFQSESPNSSHEIITNSRYKCKLKSTSENHTTFSMDNKTVTCQSRFSRPEINSLEQQNVNDQGRRLQPADDDLDHSQFDENEDMPVSVSADTYMFVTRSDAGITESGSYMDSYTVMTCDFDSGQSVDDYVTTTDMTSY